MTIQIFYPEQLVNINLSDAREWHFENVFGVSDKENADRIIVTFPKTMAKNSNVELGGIPELYFSPFAKTTNGFPITQGFITEESWSQL